MRLLVGAPVLRREWIIEQWIAHTLDAIAALDEAPEVAFLLIGGENDPTFPIIDALTREAMLTAHVIYVDEPRDIDHRKWTSERYERMVMLRNLLLEQVRRLAPDLYLSVDTDILLHPLALRNMIESSERFDAVGGRAYMTAKHRNAPSNMQLRGASSAQRVDADGVIKVDVIMAVKLMTPKAYAVDYAFDRKGEDIGICKEWKKAAVTIGYDGRVVNKHVMDPKYLNVVDARVGW